MESLRAAGTVVQLAQGRCLFAQGDASDTLYRLVSGVVRICKPLKNGRRQVQAFHVAEDVFGFEPEARRSSYAEAVSDCVLVTYHRGNIESLAQQDKAVHRQLLDHAVRNLAQAQTHAFLLGRHGAVEKIAGFLLNWSRRVNQPDMVLLVMNRQDIADYLGLTIETVSRSLTQLERDGSIALPNARQVHIIDHAALARLAA
jgi:CRP/FNR family nitrogen fixation transcriptional regulator